MLDHLFTKVMDGRNDHLGDGLRRALCRAPRAFAATGFSISEDGR
ncbi:hypothetical protein ACQEU3_38255 [Spirillospora sp. CA-253888]